MPPHGYEQGFAGYYKTADRTGPYCLDALGRAALITDPRLLTGTTNPRLRVDVAETSFFEGREFRTFKEWNVATTATWVAKVVAPINVILQELGVSCDAGSARLLTMVGGAEGGSFTEVLPRFATNNMSDKSQPVYAPQMTLAAGGTHTGGGTLLDVLRVKTSGNSNFSGSVGAGAASRGVAPATYYLIFQLDSFTGTFKARWEERP